MTWKVEFSKAAAKQIKSLDQQIQVRIRDAIMSKLLINPEKNLLPLSGDLAGLYKFRVGDYRLLCSKKDILFVIEIIRVGHRREVYH